MISPTRHPGTLVLGVLSLLFAIALAASTRAQLNAVDSARKLNAMSMQMMQQKERMLQEMKHRIKNSIARVMAIARQTASSSSNLSEFNESFAARLQAMANAQDMLTRSHWQRGDLRELLLLELEQVFGGEFATDHISGQDVELNEKASQALSLVFHELATNALKYGGDQMAVTWATEKEASGYRLRLTWSEKVDTAPDLSKKGFGTRLIDASIVGELGGTIERTYDDGVLTIVMYPSSL